MDRPPRHHTHRLKTRKDIHNRYTQTCRIYGPNSARERLAEVSWKLEDITDPDRRLKQIENGIKTIKKVVENFEKKVLEGNEILSKKKPAR
jgi:hypothetical protein